MLVGVVAACVAPEPRLRWIIPRATMTAVALSMATCLPYIDTATWALTSMPQLAVVLGLSHLAVTVTVAGIAAVLAWLIRSRLV
jgi:hypothetical protein